MPLINRRTVAGGHIPGIKDVLDSHRNAMERTFWFCPVTFSGLLEGLIFIEVNPRPNMVFTLTDSFKTGQNQLLTAERTIPDSPGGIVQTQFIKRCFHRSSIMTEDTSAIFKGADFILVVTAFQKHFAGMLPIKRRRTLHSARSFRQFNR